MSRCYVTYLSIPYRSCFARIVATLLPKQEEPGEAAFSLEDWVAATAAITRIAPIRCKGGLLP